MGSGGICPGHDLGGAEESRSAAGRKCLGAGGDEIHCRLDQDSCHRSAGDIHLTRGALLDSLMMRIPVLAIFSLLCLAPANAQLPTKTVLGEWEVMPAEGEPVAREEAGFV